MQSLGPVYIPTLSVSKIQKGPVTFHPTDQPPLSHTVGGRACHRFWDKHHCFAGGLSIQLLVPLERGTRGRVVWEISQSASSWAACNAVEKTDSHTVSVSSSRGSSTRWHESVHRGIDPLSKGRRLPCGSDDRAGGRPKGEEGKTVGRGEERREKNSSIRQGSVMHTVAMPLKTCHQHAGVGVG